MSFFRLPLLGLLGLWMLGCGFTGLPGGVQPLGQGPGWPSGPGGAVGQTFYCRYQGLQGITVVLTSAVERGGAVEFSLFTSPQESAPLSVFRAALAPGRPAGPLRFSFPVIPESQFKRYYFRIRNLGPGPLTWGAADGDTYLDGAAYRDGEPQERQLTFDLTYQFRAKTEGWLREGLTWLAVMAGASFLLLLPGWALMAWFWPGFSGLDWLEKTGLAGGVGLALIPLVLLWTDLAGWSWGPYYAWIPSAIGLAALVWRYGRQRPVDRAAARIRAERVWVNAVLVLLVGGLVLLRLANIRLLPAPLFGDSVQHTVITQLLLDHGGLFQSWMPYSPYRSFTVHYGFSAVAAALSWLGGWSSPQAVLLAGQIVNVLAVLSLYPLFVSLAGGRGWGGAATLLAAGFLSPLPAYYLNWGRYAQLSGQAVLPVMLWMIWELWKTPPERAGDTPAARSAGSFRNRWSQILLSGAVMAGMTLHHYRMPFFFLTMAVALLVVYSPPTWKGDGRRWGRNLLLLGLVILFSLVLAAPRLWHLTGSKLSGYVATGMQLSIPWSAVLDELQTWILFPRYVPWTLAGASLLGIGLALYRKHWAFVALLLWPLFMVGVIFGRLIHLPGATMMQTFATLIFLYIPLSLLAGYAVQTLFPSPRWTGGGGRSLLVASIFVLLIAVYGGAQRRIPEPGTHALVTRPDLEAMQWIARNTDPQSLFLIRETPVNRGNSVVGTDAGWWIPLLAGRSNTVPPEYALLTERPIDPGYTRNVFWLAAALERIDPASPEGLDLLRRQGITHVYLGQRTGRTPGTVSFGQLRRHPAFQLVYRQDRVAVFRFQP